MLMKYYQQTILSKFSTLCFSILAILLLSMPAKAQTELEQYLNSHKIKAKKTESGLYYVIEGKNKGRKAKKAIK